MTISRMFGTERPITNVKMHGPEGVTFESPEYGAPDVFDGAAFMHMRGFGTELEHVVTILKEEGFVPGFAGVDKLTPKMRKMVKEAIKIAS
jgi:hypothetical protein